MSIYKQTTTNKHRLLLPAWPVTIKLCVYCYWPMLKWTSLICWIKSHWL